jgi:GTP-binding protein HflX
MGAFKATLEELQDADLLLHLVDASNPRFEDQITQVRAILAELGLAEKPELVVFNKTDQLEGLKRTDTIAFLRIAQARRRYDAISISALDRTTITPLLNALKQRFWPDAD